MRDELSLVFAPPAFTETPCFSLRHRSCLSAVQDSVAKEKTYASTPYGEIDASGLPLHADGPLDNRRTEPPSRMRPGRCNGIRGSITGNGGTYPPCAMQRRPGQDRSGRPVREPLPSSQAHCLSPPMSAALRTLLPAVSIWGAVRASSALSHGPVSACLTPEQTCTKEVVYGR